MTVEVRKAVITDAGFASRYLPITKTVPKAMLPLGNRPIMQFVVEECVQAGVEEIIIVATPEGKPIYEDYFNNSVNRIRKQLAAQGKESRYEPVQHVLDFPKINVIIQDPSLPYGNGSPIASAEPFLSKEEAFLVLYSDDVVFGGSDAKILVDSYKKNPDAKAIIMGQEVPASEVDKYGIISFRDEKKRLLGNIVEKPKRGKEPSRLASYGRYLLTKDVFEHLNVNNTGLDGELWTVDAITKIAEKDNVIVEKTRGEWMTTGDPGNYFKAHLKFVMDHESYGDEVADFFEQLQKKK
ncbi:MAG: NTP transferase domain-containing protein [Pseudomonadales bacterium]|jgi:UTP--glucose-1-phosphate uridylyltransferase|nr:NTP transferase domain-containing protein [Pseudomonadales bacterium]